MTRAGHRSADQGHRLLEARAIGRGQEIAVGGELGLEALEDPLAVGARFDQEARLHVGLGVLGFETARPDERPTSAELVAETLEATVTQLAQLPEATLENDVMLEAATREAFEQAASAYFPDAVIRPEVRETANAPGIWTPMPRNRKRKYYRKYSRLFDVEIPPQLAQTVKIFGGSTLADFFEQVLLFPSGKTIKGKMHLYELTLGSRLVDIAARETSTPGLGTWSWTSWSQILPLTPEAATALLKEPGLGKAVDPVYLAGPYLTTVAQRFYFLQMPGAPMPRNQSGPLRMMCGTLHNVSTLLTAVGML